MQESDDHLGAQGLTAFGATTSQNLTTILGGHTGTEAMSTLALQYAGLKCTFHKTFTGLRIGVDF